MNQSGDRIFIFHTDPEIDQLIATSNSGKNYSRHFSQGEDFFIKLTQSVEIPAMPIHHDIRNREPSKDYVQKIKFIITQLGQIVPQIFRGMRWYFDATETLCIGFFQVLRTEETIYLALIRIDLSLRPNFAAVIAPGTNDSTAQYKTDSLFIESDIIPLRDIKQTEKGQYQFHLAQTVSETWIGETGRGYFVMGIWLDRELTKFFSKLFIPANKRLYPYYPINCKFRCVCFQPFDLDSDARKLGAAILHRCRKIIEANIRKIEDCLKGASFSDDLPLFAEMRQSIPDGLREYFRPLAIKPYLNKEDSKEFELSYES